jgi:hypothetical protein
MPPGRSLRHETCRRSERGDVPKRERCRRPPRQTPYSGYRYRVGHRKSRIAVGRNSATFSTSFIHFADRISSVISRHGMTKALSHFVFAPAGRRVESAIPNHDPAGGVCRTTTQAVAFKADGHSDKAALRTKAGSARAYVSRSILRSARWARRESRSAWPRGPSLQNMPESVASELSARVTGMLRRPYHTADLCHWRRKSYSTYATSQKGSGLPDVLRPLRMRAPAGLVSAMRCKVHGLGRVRPLDIDALLDLK